jgi:predicted patatin/cPLA2 family phospholipase
MRAAYSMGALVALEEAGLRDAFALVVGASAGALNAAYFLSGQARDAVGMYVQLLRDRRFINPLRVRCCMDIDYLIDTLRTDFPLHVDALRAASARLDVVLADADTAEPVVVTSRDTSMDFYEVLHAAIAVPMLYNKVVRLKGRNYVDGGTATRLPVGHALDAGAESVLTILTRAPGFRTRSSKRMQVVASVMARGQSPPVRRRLGRADVGFNEAMALLEERPVGRHGRLDCSVWPSRPALLVKTATQDAGRVAQCAEMGRADMMRVLEQSAADDAAVDRMEWAPHPAGKPTIWPR